MCIYVHIFLHIIHTKIYTQNYSPVQRKFKQLRWYMFFNIYNHNYTPPKKKHNSKEITLTKTNMFVFTWDLSFSSILMSSTFISTTSCGPSRLKTPNTTSYIHQMSGSHRSLGSLDVGQWWVNPTVSYPHGLFSENERLEPESPAPWGKRKST